MFNLATILESSAAERPDHPALMAGGRSVSYARLAADARRFAAALTAAGVAPGDRVALLLANTPHFPVALYGSLMAGAAVVPLNVLLRDEEVTYHLEDSGARILIAWEGFAKAAAAGYGAVESCEALWIATADPGAACPVEAPGARTLEAALAEGAPVFDTVQRSADDTAVILYTSGTTGRSKGAELSHFNLFSNIVVLTDLMALRGDDVLVGSLPLFHSFGLQVVLNAAVYKGATVSLLPRFEPGAVIETMVRDQATVFAGVPTMYWALLGADADAASVSAIGSSLRLCLSGGASMPVEILHRFEAAFDCTILEGYGLSETSPVATFMRRDRPRKPGSIGLPVWGVDVRVVDDEGRPVPPGERGEIVIRGHNVMKGYLGRPEATAEAMRGGWFHTGDIAYQDEDGYLFIVDRKKDMILRGGFSVYPREIEEVIMTHEDVSLVAVVGVPHEGLGEEVKAFVVPRSGASIHEDDFVAWCREHMGGHKYPRLVECRDALPMTATGKILKRELRA